MGIKNILKRKPKQADPPPSGAPPPVDLDPDQIQSDLDRLLQFENKIKGREPQLETTVAYETSPEDMALKLKNPFRGA